MTELTPVKRGEVNHMVTFLKLPGFKLLALSMGTELDFDTAVAQIGRWVTRRVLLRANLVSIYSP